MYKVGDVVDDRILSIKVKVGDIATIEEILTEKKISYIFSTS